MKAAVIRVPGAPGVLKIEDREIPDSRDGWVRIRVKAFGLNRSELFTRQGHSPNVSFPRILGIEAVGKVDDDPSGRLAKGQIVATAMGGMGRIFDGGYAEYTSVPASQVMPLTTSLDWRVLGALPEMVQTAHGALNTGLGLKAGDSLLIRGGTTSVGLTAAGLAKMAGAEVIATTRKPDRTDMLKANGADHVVIDTGEIADAVRAIKPGGVSKVLELVGTMTLLDSLQATGIHGTVAMVGMVGNAWELERFSPMGSIPTGVNLTTYAGGSEDFIATPLQAFIDKVESGEIKPPLGPVFTLGQIAQAHETMENDRAGGKIVVLT
ncbi:zinc-binding alcohol dehydrogenase family protein [Nioella nitratireducens]|uniref:zinc-binding alcohol dehydrogenase family protein n=1 Tax=Nioella nitratireducens TaxID=1287720 RepID=UPI0008FD1FD3|nr:zinc-binding alcohol dehydrogenase family protein [Nioella nitratireducens]